MGQVKNIGTPGSGGASQERRAWQRFVLERGAYLALEIEDDGCREEAELLDISLGGLRLRIDRELPAGVQLTIHHSSAGRMRGRLAWQRDGSIGICMSGDEKRRTYLLRLINMILHSELQVAAA